MDNYDLKPSQILQELYYLDDKEINFILGCLNRGFEEQWDCNLIYAVKNFGGAEWKSAIKSAMNIAKYREDDALSD